MMACLPARRVLSIQPAIAASQGQRSSSVSGVPRCILSTLAGGWNQSASSNSHRRRDASSAPTVDLPDPDTPMTITTAGAEGEAFSIGRFSMSNGPRAAGAAAHSQTRRNGDQASSDQLAIMHGPSVATGLMAHRCPTLLAVSGHELPGYLASSSDMSRLPSRRLDRHHDSCDHNSRPHTVATA